jgi:hypothetical protein
VILGIGPLLGGAPLDEALDDALGEAGPGDLMEIVVDVGAVAQVGAVADALAGIGAGVVGLTHLPVLGAAATPAVISAARLLPGIEGIYLNRRVDYLLAEGVTSIRADAVHALGYTGRGVGIAIMDSGIEGLVNTDVAHPAKTVQNVKFAASLRDLLTTGVALIANRTRFSSRTCPTPRPRWGTARTWPPSRAAPVRLREASTRESRPARTSSASAWAMRSSSSGSWRASTGSSRTASSTTSRS